MAPDMYSAWKREHSISFM